MCSRCSTSIDDVRTRLPAGITIDLRGQAKTMRESFVRLGFGLLFAILLVYGRSSSGANVPCRRCSRPATLWWCAGGTYVAALSPDGIVHFRKVQTGRDCGADATDPKCSRRNSA
jgi:hypothetical protein